MTGGLLVTPSTMATQRRLAKLAVPLGLATALLLTSCGDGDGSIALPSPPGSVTASVLPSRTASLPSPTRSPSRGESEEPTAAPTATTTETATETATATATATATLSPTASATGSGTASPTGSPTESPTQSSADEDGSESELPPWVWILLAVGALAAVLATLVRRSRRRRSWQRDLTAAEEEAAWFASKLLPQLQQAASPDEVAGGWRVATRRVTSIEDRLTGLEASAPDEASRTRARQLRDAIRDARQAVDDLVQTRSQATQVRELASTTARLDAALAPPTSP